MGQRAQRRPFAIPRGMNPFPHVVLELAAYAIGARLYWAARDPAQGAMPFADRLAILAGAICGAALGSKLLYVAQYASALVNQPWTAWLSGKTIAGGLLGGWAGVELAKRAVGWKASTGDRFVVPFVVALVIGRLGCQLSGAWDLTYGTPTDLPWGWDYGDGVPRHPVAGYEALALIAFLVWHRARPATGRPGERFRVFVATYLALRVLLEFLKPPFGPAIGDVIVADRHAGLTAIQWVCLAGFAVCIASLRRSRAVPAILPRH